MATPSPGPGRLKVFSEKLLKSPKALTQKLRGRGRRTSRNEPDGGLGRTAFNLDDIPLDAYAKYRYAAGKPKVIVAIDFGTTYSGYAYAFANNPDDIHLMRGAGQLGFPTHKVPTILLMNERAAFHSFGYEAREAYHDLDETESRKWLYFEKFKMELHSRKVRVGVACRSEWVHCGCDLIIHIKYLQNLRTVQAIFFLLPSSCHPHQFAIIHIFLSIQFPW